MPKALADSTPRGGLVERLLARLRTDRVVALRLHFIDLMGVSKSLEIPVDRLAEALAGQAVFDGSALEGFARAVESDVVLSPDPTTLVVLPADGSTEPLAWMLCDIVLPDGRPFDQCPRTVLKRAVRRLAEAGYEARVGAEVEFFLFEQKGGPLSVRPTDAAGYFDFTPADRGEAARQAIVRALAAAGIHVEASHHECAPGQHEIDLAPESPLKAANNLATLKLIARRVALDFGLHASFMPKPIFGAAGSGLHLHFQLFHEGQNAFADQADPHGLSAAGRGFIAGLVRHARGMAAVTNPLVNSYKRLVPGWEAPTHAVWSEQNRNPLVRVPAIRGERLRVEFRMPDPASNPYLALAVCLWAGLDGIRAGWDAGPPVNVEIDQLSGRERGRLRIHPLPADLSEAIDWLRKDEVVREALGEPIVAALVAAKRQEWNDYIHRVHQWELERYLAAY
jgi:glutamine synthetase